MRLFIHATYFQKMASKPSKWNEETLKAIEEIQQGKLSYRKAETKYGMPKSTLSDYVSGKVGS